MQKSHSTFFANMSTLLRLLFLAAVYLAVFEVHQALTCDEGYSQLLSLEYNVHKETPERQRAFVCFAVEMVMPKLNCEKMISHLKLAGDALNRKGLDSLVEIINAYRDPAKLKKLCP